MAAVVDRAPSSARLNQIADHPLPINQGTLYAALVRLELKGWTAGTWQRTESNREAKYYAITPAGRQQLKTKSSQWTRYAEAVFKVLGPA